MNKRRRFLTALGISGGTLFTYSYFRGLRYPPFVFEPRPPVDRISEQSFEADLDKLIFTGNSKQQATFRAFAPEPNLSLKPKSSAPFSFTVRNLAEDAALEIISHETLVIEENIKGINREIRITPSDDLQNIKLNWKLPALENYTFASIGDTGGDKELEWCLLRAKQLGARFLLHLGDINYQPGDYPRAIELFNNAPLPCYVAIGNHDFHEDGIVYKQFLNKIGPLNSVFTIGKTRFANIDTATAFFPLKGGLRGKLFKYLKQTNSDDLTTIAYTHEPLFDPIEGESHYIDGRFQRSWFIKSLKEAGAFTLLSGHIHVFARQDCEGIDNIIVGQGLGHQDLITNRDYSKMAIGSVDATGKVEFSFHNLGMPMNWHCHPRSDYVKESLANSEHADAIKEIQAACNKSDAQN